MNLRKGLILLAGVLAVVVAGYAVHRAMMTARPIVAAGGTAQAAAPAETGPPVIRFVEHPEAAPAFQARDLSGKMVSTADWKGKVVLLNFWATWCPPCRAEIPELIRLQEQYKDRLQIIGVSEDEDPPAKVEQFAERVGINYPVVMATPEIEKAYGGIVALPTSFVIDSQGRVETKHQGLYSQKVYNREVRALLGLSTDARIETFEDTGQVFLKNIAKATELPGVSFAGLTPEQKKAALRRLNTETCTCGCNLTVAQCRMGDSACPVSQALAAKVVKQIASGAPPSNVPSPKTDTLKGD
jgi:thiol-disulfide isomerase/thioredoxin